MKKVAINGFGRIGRLAFREIFNKTDLEIVAINDLTDPKVLAHLLKYDTTQGRYKVNDIKVENDQLIIDNKAIKILSERNPQDLPWQAMEIDIVLECTGFFTTKEKANMHLEAGAKKVVISAPAEGDLKTIVYNVNHNILTNDDKIISGASCTTNCLAPMAKVINDEFKIVTGSMTTIHAYTNDQSTLDAPHPKGDLRRARAAAESIIPNSTGAAKAIGLVIEDLQGKLDGGAQRVPTPTGSLTELVCVVEKPTTIEEINNKMQQAANESFGYTEDEIVSADVIGISNGSLFDATQTKIIGQVGEKQLIKVVSWYDNEMSYVSQLVRLVTYFSKI